MAPHADDLKKADALARLLNGESKRSVAKDMQVSRSTLGRWEAEADADTTGKLKALAESHAELRRELREEVIVAAYERTLEALPKASAKDAATIAGIAEDKALLAQGKPTHITGNAGLQLPADADEQTLNTYVDELHARRKRTEEAKLDGAETGP